MRFILIYFFAFTQTLVGAQDYNILDFGAKADGETLNTIAIQSAIDAATKNGGGRVIIPNGKFLSGALEIKSGVELHLEKGAILLGSTNPDHYFKINRWKALIIADKKNNIAVTGHGIIDGQGRQIALHLDSLFYAGQLDSIHYNLNEMRPKYYLRPQLIEFVDCKNIDVKNVTLKNAACWVQTHHGCENINIDSVRTESDAYWNNDGIDIQDCKNVRITNCYVNSADDGICLKSHHSTDKWCENIYIANCTVRSSASAVKFGTRSHVGFRNVRIENIRVFDTFRSAIAIECVDGGTLENVVIENIEATNTGNAIFIRLGKRNKKGDVGKLKNVTIKNVKVDVAYQRPDYNYEVRGPALPFFHNTFPSSIVGIPGYKIENVILENIEINYPGKGNSGLAYRPISDLDRIPENINHYPEFSMFRELPAWGFYVRHVDGLTMKNIKLNCAEPDYRPPMVFDDVQNLTISSMDINGENKEKHYILHNTKNTEIENEKAVLKQ